MIDIKAMHEMKELSGSGTGLTTLKKEISSPNLGFAHVFRVSGTAEVINILCSSSCSTSLDRDEHLFRSVYSCGPHPAFKRRICSKSCPYKL
ncbi:hypothetical protein CEXT_805801 [Caerostris extrusa]|uniref:Uncharacterized protein n=1 Tax=Caerostris extrusa TaxID=172846 RepID=A0AAV4Y8C6_CAEEX|nr:hypothetical protein CEXT_805801 [Caerostris extrusa]